MIIRLCVAAALMMPVTAMAQGNPGPYGGLFGRTPERMNSDYSAVDLRSSLGSVYDTAQLGPAGSAQDISPRGGVSGTARVDLILEHASDRFRASLSGGAARQEYLRETAYGASIYNASTSLDAQITTRLSAEVAATYARSPYFQLFQNIGQSNSAFVDTAVLPFSPYAAQQLANETLDATAGLTSQLTRRSTLSASVRRRQTLFAELSGQDVVIDGFLAEWKMQLGRGLGVHAGYGHERASYGLEQSDQPASQSNDFEHEIIDVGVDFNREFSVARRTTLAFTTTTSIIKDSSTRSRHFRLNGSVTLSKYFRRTWRVTAEARRDTSFLPGFGEPVLSDTVGISLGGMFTKRIDWMAGASGGMGRFGFSDRPGFETVSATTVLNVALNKYLGLYTQYVAYWNQVPPDSTTLDLPEQLDRQSVFVGLSAYFPLYNKTRRP